ncbi:hypothetical protein QBC37DRAFT_446837 [Rhypophila decipiens]|uniref:Uncharacterized protein n=1 Tax=Rhypophila decipiens TaxID=261697 RepID=A0AAN6Y823_9PEZI|nr:hypothetical protein QBC37DRAFT_446837 [Rhypophila decipiens]
MRFTTTVFQLVAVLTAVVAPAMACYCVNNAGADNESTLKCCNEAGGKWKYPLCETFSMTRSQRIKFQNCCTRSGEKPICS